MTPELLTILPNLSIGVIAIGGLIFVVIKFLGALDSRADKHETAMREREVAMRSLEAEIRSTLTDHLTQASIALTENSRVLSRVVLQFEKL